MIVRLQGLTRLNQFKLGLHILALARSNRSIGFWNEFLSLSHKASGIWPTPDILSVHPPRSSLLLAQGKIKRRPLYWALIGTVLGFSLLTPGPTFGQTQLLSRTVSNNASCTQPTDGIGNVVCAVMGNDNTLYGIEFNPKSNYHSSLQSLGGTWWGGNPSCAPVANGSDDVVCGIKGTDSSLYGIRFNPRTNYQTNLQLIGRMDKKTWMDGDPNCAPANDSTGDLVCAVTGTDSRLYGIRFNPATNYKTSFQCLQNLNSIATVGNVACVAAGGYGGDVVCAVRNTGTYLYGIRFNPKTGYQSSAAVLGGTWAGNLSCAALSGGDVACAARDTTGNASGIRFNPQTGHQTSPQSLGVGIIDDGLSCAKVWGSDDVVCVFKSRSALSSNELDEIRFNPATSYEYWGQVVNTMVFVGDPSCAPADDGSTDLFCAVKGTDSALYGLRFTQ